MYSLCVLRQKFCRAVVEVYVLSWNVETATFWDSGTAKIFPKTY